MRALVISVIPKSCYNISVGYGQTCCVIGTLPLYASFLQKPSESVTLSHGYAHALGLHASAMAMFSDTALSAHVEGL